MLSACVFCGRTDAKITKEHVLPNWISTLFPSIIEGTAQMVKEDGSVHSFPMRAFQQQVRVVCKPCNEGWMNDLETSVKDLLGPMIRHGRATRLARFEQKQFAMWAIKTAMMLNYLYPRQQRVVPDTQLTDFYAAKAPLSTHSVWIAARESLENEEAELTLSPVIMQALGAYFIEPPGANDAPRWKEEERKIYRITFAVGHVAFQVFGHNLPRGDHIIVPGIPPPGVLKQIGVGWRRVGWPPPRMIESIGGLQGFHEIFDSK
jgi:hypothetical protein